MNEEQTNPQECEKKISYPTTISELILLCKRFIRMARSGECGEDEITRGLARSCPKRFGYFRETDYLTADESMRVLGLNQNRNKFFELIKIHKIKAQTFKGLKIGYYADDIYELKETLREEKKCAKKGVK